MRRSDDKGRGQGEAKGMRGRGTQGREDDWMTGGQRGMGKRKRWNNEKGDVGKG